MIPDNELSTQVMDTTFYPPDDRPRSFLKDYELGGIAVADASEGLQYQSWMLTYENGSIVITPELTQDPPTTVFTLPGISQASLSFDQNMNVFVAYVLADQSYYYWYDPIALDYVHQIMDADVTFPRCTMDDKRLEMVGTSDIILGYMRGKSFYYREERDRYTIEYHLHTFTDETERFLDIISMNEFNRLQFQWKQDAPIPDGSLTNEEALALIETGSETGWIDLSPFETKTFDEVFGVSLDGPDFTKVVSVEGGIKIPMNPSVVGPVEIYVVDSLDMNNLQMLSTAATGSVYGGLNYQNWEIALPLNFLGGYDNFLVIASDTGNARLRKMDATPIAANYGVKVDPQYTWMYSRPEVNLSIIADLEVLQIPNGAIMLVDASDPASYPGTGATWFDLTGNGNDFDLVGSPPFNPAIAGGVFEFPGSATVYAQILSLNLQSIDHTISYVTRYGPGAKGRILGSGVGGGNWLGGYHGGTSGKYYANGWVWQSALGDEEGWKHVTITGKQTGDLWQLFNNGVALHTANNLGSAGPNGLRFGGDATYSSEYADCDGGWLIVYPRILNQTEITQLHDHIKGRFGIA